MVINLISCQIKFQWKLFYKFVISYFTFKMRQYMLFSVNVLYTIIYGDK